jgi:hypothetical protein
MIPDFLSVSSLREMKWKEKNGKTWKERDGYYLDPSFRVNDSTKTS